MNPPTLFQKMRNNRYAAAERKRLQSAREAMAAAEMVRIWSNGMRAVQSGGPFGYFDDAGGPR